VARVLIFDVDGTLIDSNDQHATAWREAFLKFGHDVPYEEIRGQIGKGGDQLVPVFLDKGQREQYGAELEHYRSELFKSKYLQTVRPFPRVRELFQRILDDGHRIALASSAKGDELEQYKRLLHVEDLLAADTSKDDARRSKPHPDIFRAALEKLGNPPTKHALVIGDTPWDAQAARALGVAVVGVLCGGFPERDLIAAGCGAIYRDPAELLAGYDRSPLSAP
jgi:HAD superfamily hydrolase (TIGR01549 family)